MQIIRLLGGAAIEGPSGPLTGREVQRARLALLALIAAARSRSVSRERLMAMLWPESNVERARHMLRDSAYRIREALGDAVLPGAGDELRLDAAHIRCDVWEFEEAVARGDLAGADRLYAGPFLDGFFLSDSPEFERWTDAERSRLTQVHAHVLESIATTCSERGDRLGAVAAWRRLAAAEPHNGRIAVRLMEALDSAGDRAGALKHAAMHAALLDSDLGAAPDPDVAAYGNKLRYAPRPRGLPLDSEPAMSPATAPSAPNDVDESVTPAPSQVEPQSAARPVGAWLWWAAAAMLALVASPGVSWLRHHLASSAGAPSITVLASESSETDSSAVYFSEGMAENITTILAKNPRLTVKFSRSALAAGARRGPLRDIGRALQVANVLTLDVRRDGALFRVTAHLTRVADGKVLWSEQYDREGAGMFLVQDQIAQAIAGALRVRLAAVATTADSGSFGTTDPDAYDSYLQGRYYLDRRGSANLQLALGHFRRALARDARFARAHAGVSATATLLTLYDPTTFASDSMLALAVVAGEQAVAMNDALGDGHAALGQALTYLGRREEAEREYRQAVSLDPRSANAHQWFAELLISEGRSDEATAEMGLSTQCDPLSGINFAVAGNHLRMAGRFDEALRFGQRAAELNPSIPAIWEFYARTLFFAGLRDSAIRVFAQHSPRHPMSAYMRAVNGDRTVIDSLRRVMKDPRYAAPVDGTVPPSAIMLAAGNPTRALDALERRAARSRAFPLHDPLVDQIYDPIRDSTRFRDVVRRAGLDEELNIHPRRRR